MKMLSTTSYLIGSVFLHIALFGMGLVAVISAHAESPTGRSPADRVADRIKMKYDFETWAGTVKTNLSIFSLANLDRELEARLKMPIASRVTRDTNAVTGLGMEIIESKTRSGCRIRMTLYPTAREAQEAPFREFAFHSREPTYVLAVRGSDFDIGDMCLYNLATNVPDGIAQIANRPFVGRLYFSRGNVAVTIINNAKQGKEYVDVLSIAKEIDALLYRKGRQTATDQQKK